MLAISEANSITTHFLSGKQKISSFALAALVMAAGAATAGVALVGYIPYQYFYLGIGVITLDVIVSCVLFAILNQKKPVLQKPTDEFHQWSDLPQELQFAVMDQLPPKDLIHTLASTKELANLKKYYEGKILIAKFLDQFDHWYKVQKFSIDRKTGFRCLKLEEAIQKNLFIHSILNAKLNLPAEALEFANKIIFPELRIKALLAIIDIVNPTLAQKLLDETWTLLKQVGSAGPRRLPFVNFDLTYRLELLIKIAKKEKRNSIVTEKLNLALRDSKSLDTKPRLKILLKIARLKKSQKESLLDEAFSLIPVNWQSYIDELQDLACIEERDDVKRGIINKMLTLYNKYPLSTEILVKMAKFAPEKTSKYQYLDEALQKASTPQDFLKIAEIEDRKDKKHSLLDTQYVETTKLPRSKDRYLTLIKIIKLDDRKFVKKERTQKLIADTFPPNFNPKILLDPDLIEKLTKIL